MKIEKKKFSANEDKIIWEVRISLSTNPFILKQLGMMLLFPSLFMAMLLSFLLLVTGEPEGIPEILLASIAVVLGMGLLLLFIILLVFRNRFHVRFSIDAEGVLWEILDKLSKISSRLAVAAGLLDTSPLISATGIQALSREKEFISWKDVESAEYNQGRHMILLRNSWRPVMMLICSKENYGDVLDLVKQRFRKPDKMQLTRSRNPVIRLLVHTFLVMLASVPVFMLPYPFELDILVPLIMLLFALATVWLVPFMGFVVMGCTLFLTAQIVIISLQVKKSMFFL